VNNPVVYRLRPSTQDDYEFIYQVKKTALGPYVAATWGWDETFQRAYHAQGFDPAEYRVILVDSQEIGVLAVQYGDSEINLSELYILPEYQRLGHGSSIIKDLLTEGKLRSRRLKLGVLKVNPAKRLYERLGFTVIEENQNYFMMHLKP